MKLRRAQLLCVVGITVAWTSSAGAETFGPYLGDATETTLSVSWRTDTPSSSRVEWAVGTNPTVLDQIVEDSTLVVQHEVVLTGLTPGVQHTYKVVSEASANVVFEKGPFTFYTAAPAGTPFRFAFLAEVHAEAEVAMFDEEIAAFDPWLQVQCGDNIDDSDSLPDFQSFFGQGNWYGGLPLFNSFGNHNYQTDSGGLIPDNTDAVLSLEVMAPHERYYTFRYGDVQFFALDAEHYLSDTVRDDEPGWLEQELTDATDGVDDPTFKIAFFHIPPFSSCGDLTCVVRKIVENPWVDAEFVTRIESFGVDLVLVGHDKINEHTIVNGVHYVQVTSGASPRGLGANNPGSVWAGADGRAIMLATVQACTLSFQIVGPDGTELHAGSITGDCVDNDNDGYNSTVDCDDDDPTRNPGADEICGDGIDQDCDGSDVPCAGTDAGPTDPDAGPANPDAGPGDPGSDAGTGADSASGGCGCGSAGATLTSSSNLWLLLGAFAIALRRRRRCRG